MQTNLYPATGLMQPLTNPSVTTIGLMQPLTNLLLRANVVMLHMLLAIGLMQPLSAMRSIAGSRPW